MRRLKARRPATAKTAVNGPHDGFSAGQPRDREATPRRLATQYLLRLARDRHPRACAPVEVIRKALLRDAHGVASSPLGVALDLLANEP